jgi:hypothetical protein
MEDNSGIPPEEPEGEKLEGTPKKKALDKDRVPPPLPATRAELDAQLKVARRKSLNDWVHELHRAIWEDPEYSKYFHAIYHSQAIEGFLATDHTEAARYLRDYARTKGIDEVGKELLHSVEKALALVRRHYAIDVQTRQRMLDGEIVPNGNGNEDEED